ncbi:hypothetical protein TYRP_010600 [Tyrophagus putrescentiae]|nr:hypothetical protein TYRP_010600 [Tyrophagus putrescentiae]
MSFLIIIASFAMAVAAVAAPKTGALPICVSSLAPEKCESVQHVKSDCTTCMLAYGGIAFAPIARPI